MLQNGLLKNQFRNQNYLRNKKMMTLVRNIVKTIYHLAINIMNYFKIKISSKRIWDKHLNYKILKNGLFQVLDLMIYLQNFKTIFKDRVNFLHVNMVVFPNKIEFQVQENMIQSIRIGIKVDRYILKKFRNQI